VNELMDLQNRLEACQSAQDLFRLASHLEAELLQLKDPVERARLHLQLGHLSKGQCLDGIAAIRHFQEAFKSDPARLDALGAARSTYLELGRLPLVHKLLCLEISAVSSIEAAGHLYLELGHVLSDQGQAELAAEAYAEALKVGFDARAFLEDAQVDHADYSSRIDWLVEQSAGGDVTLLLRAAAIAARFEPDLAQAILLRAYRVAPSNERVAALIEGAFVESDQAEDLLGLQRDILEESGTPVDLLYQFGARWAERHVPEAAVPLLQRALAGRVSARPVINFLYRHAQDQPEYQPQFLEITRTISQNDSQDPALSYLLATAGLVALQDVKDNGKATEFFARLALVDPTHRALVEFREHVAAKTATHSNSESILGVRTDGPNVE